MQTGSSPRRAWKTFKDNLRPFLKAAPDAVMLAGQPGHILLANPQIHFFFESAGDELAGKPIAKQIS